MKKRPALLPDLLQQSLARIGWKLERGQSVADELGRALELIDRLSPADVARADTAIATAACLHHRSPPKPNVLSLFTRRLSDKEQLLELPGLEFLFLFHRDGRIREAALLKIAGGLLSPFLFAAVAWRLNDWAEPVRAAAVRCARRTFAQTDPQIIAQAAAAGLLIRQGGWRRWSDEQSLLDEAFARDDVALLLADIIRTSATGPMAATLRHALRSRTLDPHLECLAREGVQPAVRAAAIDALIDGRASWPAGVDWQWVDKPMGIRRPITVFGHRPLEVGLPRASVVSLGVADRSAVVRRVALAGVIRHQLGTPEARELASRLAADRSPSVRERAHFILRSGDC